MLIMLAWHQVSFEQGAGPGQRRMRSIGASEPCRGPLVARCFHCIKWPWFLSVDTFQTLAIGLQFRSMLNHSYLAPMLHDVDHVPLSVFLKQGAGQRHMKSIDASHGLSGWRWVADHISSRTCWLSSCTACRLTTVAPPARQEMQKRMTSKKLGEKSPAAGGVVKRYYVAKSY